MIQQHGAPSGSRCLVHKDSMEDIDDDSVPDLVDDHQEAVEELWLERNAGRICWVNSILTHVGSFLHGDMSAYLGAFASAIYSNHNLAPDYLCFPHWLHNFSTMVNTNRFRATII